MIPTLQVGEHVIPLSRFNLVIAPPDAWGKPAILEAMKELKGECIHLTDSSRVRWFLDETYPFRADLDTLLSQMWGTRYGGIQTSNSEFEVVLDGGIKAWWKIKGHDLTVLELAMFFCQPQSFLVLEFLDGLLYPPLLAQVWTPLIRYAQQADHQIIGGFQSLRLLDFFLYQSDLISNEIRLICKRNTDHLVWMEGDQVKMLRDAGLDLF